MPRPETKGFQKPIRSTTTREVGLAVITYSEGAGYQLAQCSCNWTAYAKRLKVLDDKIDKHVEKKHQGRSIRL